MKKIKEGKGLESNGKRMAMNGIHEGMVFGKRPNEAGSEQQGRHEMGAC